MIPTIDFDVLVGKPGPAAKLLSCIVSCYRQRTVAKNGDTWSPVPRGMLLTESNLSLDQYHRAMRTLRQRRLIVDVMGYWKGTRMPHFRLGTLFPQVTDVQPTAFQGSELTTMDEPVVQLIALQGGETPTVARVRAGAGLESKKESKKGSKEESKTSVHSHAVQGSGKVSKVFGRKSEGKTVSEILAETKSKAEGHASKPPTLEHVWSTTLAAEYKCFVPALTVKDKSQLKHFAKICPEGTAEKVIRYAIAEWGIVSQQAATEEGAFNLPHKPMIGFIVKYAASVINAFLQHKPKKVVPPLQLTAKPVAPVAPKPAKIDDTKATLEELMAALSEDGDV